jgi:GNAT superfamily N-acetyltransferase
VARELAEFLGRMHPARDGFWLARVAGDIAGSISIDGSPTAGSGAGGCKGSGEGRAEVARLRWFILDPAYHGQGIGGRLMEEAMAFCEEAGFARVFLCSFAGLDAARHLYERHGFTLREEHEDDQWGKTVTEQLFERLIT